MAMTFDMLAPPTMLADVAAVFRAVLLHPDLDLTLATPLENIDGWDSMSHIAVMVELECRFGLTLEPHEIEAVQTVGDVVRTIGARCALYAA
jgi:acyl carrier protein